MNAVTDINLVKLSKSGPPLFSWQILRDCGVGSTGSTLMLFSNKYFFLSFFIFCNTPSRGLRAGVITSYCHSTKCKKKKKVDDSG